MIKAGLAVFYACVVGAMGVMFATGEPLGALLIGAATGLATAFCASSNE